MKYEVYDVITNLPIETYDSEDDAKAHRDLRNKKFMDDLSTDIRKVISEEITPESIFKVFSDYMNATLGHYCINFEYLESDQQNAWKAVANYLNGVKS